MSKTPFDVLSRLPDDYDWERHDAQVPKQRLEAAVPPRGLTDHKAGSAAYRPDKDLITAVNAAIHLRAPLLVTGDPGTGKTQLAYFTDALLRSILPRNPVVALSGAMGASCSLTS